MAKIITQIPSIGNGLHNDLNGLNEGDYQHLTELEKNNLEFITNKQDSLEIDGTGNKYPTVDAINAEVEIINDVLDQKLNIVDYNEYFQGKYSSLLALQTAKPTGKDGDYAIVDIGAGEDAKTYLWDSEDGWVEGGSSGAATTDALPEGSTNLYFQAARVLATVLNGISFAVGTPVTSADNILVGFGKIQKQISDLITAVANIFQPNQLISSVAPTRSVNTFTFPAEGYEALINKTLRTNPASFVTTIATATIDYKRIDLIWFKDDNTLQKVVGTESLTVAVRPDIPVGQIGVPVSFINVFGDVIETPTPITNEISIQDVFGTEIFKVPENGFMRFEGVSMNPAQKLISINPLVPLSAFLDVTNGNDVTGAIENASKPFKTLEKLISSLPATTGETYTIYLRGATIPVLKQIPIRNLNWVSYTGSTLDFSNTTDSSGNPANYVLLNSTGTIRTWTFINDNISIVSNYVGQRQFGYNNSASLLYIRGTINTLNWKSVGNIASRGGFIIHEGSDFTVINLYDSPQANSVFSASGFTAVTNINVDNYNIQYGRSIAFIYNGTINIKKINHLGTGTLTWAIVSTNASTIVDFSLGDITFRGTVQPAARNLFFNNSNISSTATINLQTTDVVSGRALSTTYMTNLSLTTNQIIRNFSGKINEIRLFNNGQITFEDCILDINDRLIRKYTGSGGASTRDDVIVTKGFNAFTMSNLSGDLLYAADATGGNSDVILLNNYGTIKTNVPTYGRKVTYVDNTATFKEKLNERVIRSKWDLINRVLSSTVTYIIDANIVLLTGEYIQIPAGGLTLTGYGFDVSSISKNITGQSIFTSPVGNSGNFVSSNIAYFPGIGSVFNITDSTGNHAIELNDVNFQGVTGSSLGIINGYRQFTGTTCGFYGLSDGLTLEGNWSGFKLTNTNIIGFASSGTLFKKGTATLFSNRFYIDLNLQIATGSKICDFTPSNFTNDKSLQVVNCYTKVNGVIDDTTTAVTFPNITPYDAKSYFVNNIGIKNSNQMPYGISTTNMQTYADDAAAASGGIVPVGEIYIESSTGYFKKRLT